MEEKLKVLILCNNAFVKGNGLCTAVQSLISRLRAAGVDARLMAAENVDDDNVQPDFPLKHFKFPFFEPIIYANGFRFATADRKRMRKAIEWADVLHIQEAFPLELIAANIARKLGKPVVGTFHLFPENITANLGIAKIQFVSDLILNFWRDRIFNKCTHIQCPTELVRKHLVAHNFTSELRTISNGVEIKENTLSNPDFDALPVKVLCIGRLSREKDQMTLLNAMRYSRHAKEIELVFAGKGPFLKKYTKAANRLLKDGVIAYKPGFNFYNKEELAQLASEAYLYIHCAWVEVEGLSCVEALREGVVPVIAQGALSATSQFALDEHSSFPVFDSKALAERIDWWIEHRSEHDEMRSRYQQMVRNFDEKKSTLELIQMYRDAIAS